MPDERRWRIWDMFIYLGEKYGIVITGVFTLVPEEMGDPRGWFGSGGDRLRSGSASGAKEFLLALDRRYRQVPGITWDLFNEPYMRHREARRGWAADLGRPRSPTDGSHRLLTVGGPCTISRRESPTKLTRRHQLPP